MEPRFASLDSGLEMLRCPVTGEGLHREGDRLVTRSGRTSYAISVSGVPLFAEKFCSPEARAQQKHYDRVAKDYLENLAYPHTQEYMDFIYRVIREEVGAFPLGAAAEICCGQGEAFALLGDRVRAGIGVDISLAMLEAAQHKHAGKDLVFVQGDATALPLADGSFDSVFMFGGIHHVNNRRGLFAEVFRILKPGGRFFFREPVSDFFLWRLIREVVYRISPALDHKTERPLLYYETVPFLKRSGFRMDTWRTVGFLGFCLFANSDVLVFNRAFRFVPGIRSITRFSTRIDTLVTQLPGLRHAGLQVIGSASKVQAPPRTQSRFT